MLETKRLLEYAGNQRESCRRQENILKKELVEFLNVAETKTREVIALVDERECLARELEKAKIEIRKLRTKVRKAQTSKMVIQRRLEAIKAPSAFSLPPNFYELLFLPHGTTTRTMQKHFKTLEMLCHPDKGRPVQNYSSGKTKITEDEEARNVYDKHGIEKAEEFMNLKLDREILACERVEHSHFL